MHSFNHCIHEFIHSFIHSSIHPSIRSSSHASIHPFIHSSVHPETSDHPPTPFSLPSSLYSPTLHHIPQFDRVYFSSYFPQFDRVCFSSYYNPFSIRPQSSAEPSVKNRFITLIGNWLGWVRKYALTTNAYKNPSLFLHCILFGISIDFRLSTHALDTCSRSHRRYSKNEAC